MTGCLQQLLKRELGQALQQGIRAGVFSGAQASFSLADGAIHTVVAGATAYGHIPSPAVILPISPTTLFDVASLTKLFTTTIALKLVDDGVLRLDTHIWNGFTLASLLAHETGLPAWKPLFEQIPLSLRGTEAARQRIIQEVLATSAQSPPPHTAVYSDLGFIGLGHHLTRITKKDLPTLVRERITRPYHMRYTVYDPEISPTNTNIACTEQCPWRGVVLQGQVHDDNTWTMGGVAGHAGIFSTSEDIAALGVAWLNALQNDGIVTTSLAKSATQKRPGGRGLGFDIKTPGTSSVGDYASDATFGHLGFTGTSLWIDPKHLAVISLLTNRVHPSRDNIKIRAFRPAFHNLFFQNIG